MSESLFNEGLVRGFELTSGFRILGNKAITDGVYLRNIILIEAESKGDISVKQLLSVFEAEAKAGGAKKIIIGGYSIRNPKLQVMNARFVARFGYTLDRVGDHLFLEKILK